MQQYVTRAESLAGTDAQEIHHRARQVYQAVYKNKRRRPYVRSAYFKKEKIFLDVFWQHLNQKNWRDRNRRLKLFPCAMELIQLSLCVPTVRMDFEQPHLLLYRFAGCTPAGELFFVQIKHHLKTDQKFLISIFPK